MKPRLAGHRGQFVLELLEPRQLLAGNPFASTAALLTAPLRTSASPSDQTRTLGRTNDGGGAIGSLDTLPTTGVFSASGDIGSPAITGSTAYSNGTYTITAAGSDIGGLTDQCQFAWNPWNGDGSIIARVTSLVNTNSFAKAGVMFRSGTGDSAAFVGLFMSPSNSGTVSLITRSTDGGAAGQTSSPLLSIPRYLMLSRSGSTFTGFQSANGTTWTQIGTTQTATLGSNPLVGIAATSRNVSTATTATFTNVSLLLPAGAVNNDIGAPGQPGFTVYDPTTNEYLVTGGGSDFGTGATDSFNFQNRAMTGDGAVSALVDALPAGSDPGAKAGVMIRDTAAANAMFAAVARTGTSSIAFTWRAVTGGAGQSVTVPGLSGPVWVKVTQTGNAFSAYYSADNQAWTQVGTNQSIVMTSATTLAGPAVTSHNNAALLEARVRGASVVQGAWSAADVSGSNVPRRGSATFDAASGTYTLVASGGPTLLNSSISPSPIGPRPRPPANEGNGDRFTFASRAMNGDGAVLAYVNSLTNTDPDARAGVLIRASAAPASAAAYAAMWVSAGNGAFFEVRTATGASVVRQYSFPPTAANFAPMSLRLTRTGNAFRGYYSTDGVTWTQVGASQTVVLPATASAGVAVAANSNAEVCTSAFSAVGVGANLPAGAGFFSSSDEFLLNDLSSRTVQYFYTETNATTGMVPDSALATGGGPSAFSSIAATGFGLTALTIGDKRGWLTHANAYQRALNTVTFLQNTAAQVNGFFYHFLNPTTGARFGTTELSSIDTALLMAGVLNVAEYWQGTAVETVAMNVFNRVNWPWMQKPNGQFYGEWTPEFGFRYGYGDFSEAVLLYLLGLGSGAHPTATSSWTSWSRSPVVSYSGYTFVTAQTGALFVHQYPHAWFDLRGKTDSTGLNYVTNSISATMAQRQMCINLAATWPASYGPNLWGITASDSSTGYQVWGGPPATANINGTVVPTAPAGSLTFTPRRSMDVLKNMQQTFGSTVYKKYGFVDAFNPTTNWTSSLVLGIDAGMLLAGAENARSNFVWDVFRQSAVSQTALSRAFPGQIGSGTDDSSPGDAVARQDGAGAGATAIASAAALFHSPFHGGRTISPADDFDLSDELEIESLATL